MEVETTMKQMTLLKEPSPIGMPPIFFQTYSEVIGNDVTQAIPSCLKTSKILKLINHTFITLIP